MKAHSRPSYSGLCVQQKLVADLTTQFCVCNKRPDYDVGDRSWTSR